MLYFFPALQDGVHLIRCILHNKIHFCLVRAGKSESIGRHSQSPVGARGCSGSVMFLLRIACFMNYYYDVGLHSEGCARVGRVPLPPPSLIVTTFHPRDIKHDWSNVRSSCGIIIPSTHTHAYSTKQTSSFNIKLAFCGTKPILELREVVTNAGRFTHTSSPSF